MDHYAKIIILIVILILVVYPLHIQKITDRIKIMILKPAEDLSKQACRTFFPWKSRNEHQ